ncbi:MAG: Maf family protein, partial [Planctomycetota bacterium]
MDRQDANQRRLVLASRSPRRRAMLEDAGIAFDVAEGVDDGGLLPGSADADHWVAALAFLKAWSVARDLDDQSVVLGADTVCAADGSLLGKPADADEARQMLASFVG